MLSLNDLFWQDYRIIDKITNIITSLWSSLFVVYIKVFQDEIRLSLKMTNMDNANQFKPIFIDRDFAIDEFS